MLQLPLSNFPSSTPLFIHKPQPPLQFLHSQKKPKRQHTNTNTQMKRMNMITMKRVVARSLTDTSTIGSSSLSFLRSLSSASSTTADVDVASSVAKLVTPTFLQPRVVLYDGVCHLCRRGVKWVIRADKDKKIKFCCVQSNAAEPYLRASGLEREDVLRRFYSLKA